MRALLGGLLFGFLTLVTASPSEAKRLALVIGNDDYAQVAKLHKAVNDARAMGETLGRVGFEVIRAENVTRREMNRQLQLFVSRLEAGDEAMFFYAGHGVEIAGRNYLLPVDIPSAMPGQEDFVRAEAIPVDHVLDTIRSRGTRIAVLVLDACRDNPFPKAGTRSLGTTRGLGRSVAPEGTFIMYSAGVGQTALDRLADDDPHPNSVFTRSLIPLLQRQGVSLTQMARQVRRDVQKLAATVPHDQRPAYYDEVTGDFFFAGRPAATAATGPSLPLPPTDPAAQAWAAIQHSTSPAVMEAFVKQFPDSLFATFAKARLEELRLASLPPETPPADDPARQVSGARPAAKAAPAAPPEEGLPALIATAPPFPLTADMMRLPEPLAPPSLAPAPEHLCDRLAAADHDPQSVAAGWPLTAIRTDDAVQACTEAVLAFPHTPRFAFQLAQALESGAADGKALEWYRKAAEAGSTAAMRTLGHRLSQFWRDEIDVDFVEAARWFRRAATLGDALAYDDMGGMLRRMRRPEANAWFAEAERLWRQRAEAGDGDAMARIGRLYEQGLGREPDEAEAISWYRRAADRGSLSGMRSLAGKLRYHDDAEAVRWYEKALSAAPEAAPSDWGMTELIGYYEGLEDRGRTRAQELQKRYEGSLAAAAQRGNALAMRQLGHIHLRGYAIAVRDVKKAIAWLEKAAAAGDATSMHSLAEIFLEDATILLRNAKEAERWLTRLAEAGRADAMRRLGQLYTEGSPNFPRNLEKARHWWGRALDRYKARAEQGDTSAAQWVGYIYTTYWPGPRNKELAYEWILKGAVSPEGSLWSRTTAADAIMAGEVTLKDPELARKVGRWVIATLEAEATDHLLNTHELRQLGEIYETGDLSYKVKNVVAPDLAKAADYYLRAARGGDDSAMERLARLYHRRALLMHAGEPLSRWKDAWLSRRKSSSAFGYAYEYARLEEALRKGEFVTADPVEAERWRNRYAKALERKAARGLVSEMGTLADLNAGERGATPNPKAAIQWYERAAEAGNAWSAYKLAEIYREGKLTKKDINKAIAHLTMIAEKGYVSAMDRLADIYREGEGVPKNAAKALAWARKAAESGPIYQLTSLASRYLVGYGGVDKNAAEALRLYRLAADFGSSYAMHNLGEMYRDGNGVAANAQEAVRWFRMAAQAGEAQSMAALAVMLDKGQGSARDPAEAARLIVRLIGQASYYADNVKGEALSAETRAEVQRLLAGMGLFRGSPDGRSAHDYDIAVKAYAEAK